MPDLLTQGNISQDKALDFILGGNALFTCKSNKTGTRYTYKVLRDKYDKNLFKVSYLYGPDNTVNYRKIGHIIMENFMPMYVPPGFVHNEKSVVTAFEYIIMNLAIKLNMPSLEIWHEGRCCRCGRVLTVPESIMNGIGPECIFKL